MLGCSDDVGYVSCTLVMLISYAECSSILPSMHGPSENTMHDSEGMRWFVKHTLTGLLDHVAPVDSFVISVDPHCRLSTL